MKKLNIFSNLSYYILLILIYISKEQENNDKKYITFFSNWGFNNQRQVFRATFYFAYLLNRTLTLPKKQKHKHDKTVANWNQYYNIKKLSEIVNITYIEDLKKINKNIYWYNLNISHKTTIITNVKNYSSYKNNNFVSLKDITKKIYFYKNQYDKDITKFGEKNNIIDIQDLQKLNHTFLRYTDKYCWMESMFLFSNDLQFKLNDIEKKYFQYNAEIFEIANEIYNGKILNKKYDTLHFRVGDKKIRSYFQVDIITDIVQNAKNKKLYIATNDAYDFNAINLRKNLQKNNITTFVLRDLIKSDHYIFNFGMDFVMCVEQVICSHSDKFFPTIESSVSEYILFLRWWNNKGNYNDIKKWYISLQKKMHIKQKIKILYY